MYSDKKKRRWPLLKLEVVCILMGTLAGWKVSGTSARDMEEESAVALLAAIQRSALQCYVVEGNYPPNLAYLEENYGLQVNTRDFYVVYDAFASNLPPYVSVLAKP